MATNPETIERFRREAKALASVLHQNVAHVYDFVEDGGESYILMEYIEGIDLADIIAKVGAMPAEIAVAMQLGVCRGVAYIHAHNLIHRDIKPANIRVTTRGEVKLMDFGIVLDIQNQGLTRPGMMVGSPSYLSPEQVLGDSVSPSADIFLIGICLYEMLTGSKPFQDDGRETVFQRIRAVKYIPVHEMQPGVPKILESIVDRCLQRDPKDRFENVREMISELENFLGTERSSRCEDVILKYLDGEALVIPSIRYYDFKKKRNRFHELFRRPLRLVFYLLLAAALFSAGYFLGSRRLIISRIALGPYEWLGPTKPLPARKPASKSWRQ